MPKFRSLAIFSIITVLLFSVVFNSFSTVSAAECKSVACKNAEAAEAAARAKAYAAASAAQTLEGEVERLNAEVEALEASILALEAKIKDLETQISKNKLKLRTQQSVLASLLVDLHFSGNPDTIMILAGSSSISDYAERQSRVDTVKNQITISTQAVKKLKQQLEEQKAEVDTSLINQKVQQESANEKVNEKNALIAQYRNNAAAYAKDAEEARQRKLRLMENATASITGSSSRIWTRANGSVPNDYYLSGECTYSFGLSAYYNIWMGRYGVKCQCTDYAGWKVHRYTGRHPRAFGITGNAWQWAHTASGARVDNIPARNTVAVQPATGSNPWGHVMWVEEVYGDGTILVSEYNAIPFSYSNALIRVSGGLNFIHFD